MNIFIKAIILGIVEGITEFLPISSTGHLIIVNQIISFTGKFAHMFDIVIQLGAILSVIVYFRDKIYPLRSHTEAKEKEKIWQLWKKTMAGLIPAILIGGIFGDKVEELLFTPTVVAITLLLGGVVLIFIENMKKKNSIIDVYDIPYRMAIAIGFAQCLALVPGVSRSAATILGAMLLGTSREVAAEFSFFLAIPTMMAATAYSLLKTGVNITIREWQVLGLGFLVSFLVAWLIIAIFMNYIRKNDFKLFGYYRIILGSIILINLFI